MEKKPSTFSSWGLTYLTPPLLVRSKLKSEHNLDVKFVQLDITDLKSIEAAKATIEKAEGKLDVLVNNAGMYTSPRHSNDYVHFDETEDFRHRI